MKTLFRNSICVIAIAMMAMVSCSCQEKEVEVTGVSVFPTTMTIYVGGSTANITATEQPDNATYVLLLWSSSNASVATVSDNGTVTWISKGAATITATTVDNGFNATCKVEATDIINIPDINFKDCLFEACSDTNNDGKISLQEAKNITEIDCMVLEIGSLEGIQYYTELTYLDCCYNQLTSIDVSANTKLVQLVCYSNHLSVLNVSHNTKMATLLCGNQKTSYGLNFQQLSLTLLNSQLGMWNIMTSPNSPNYASFNTHVELT